MSKTNKPQKFLFINHIQTKLGSMNFQKKLWYFVCLGLTIICLILCLWGSITVGISQQTEYANLLVLKSHGQLEIVYPELAINGSWYYKGVEQFSWYLVSIQPIGAVAYYFAAIFGIAATPLLIYYISGFMVIAFPKKDKSEKKKKSRNKKLSKDGS